MNQQTKATGKLPAPPTEGAVQQPPSPPAETSQDTVTELSDEELNDRKRQRIKEIKEAEASFLELLAYLAPNGNPTRELNLARTNIEQGAMWAIKGVVAQ